MPNYLFHSNWLELIKDKNILLFFDFDGTLVPIRKNPDDCYLSDNLRNSLNELKDKIKIGIISGRDLEDLKKRISLEGIYYGGIHGLQIEGLDVKYTHPDAQKLKPYIDEVYVKVKNLSEEFEGALVEKKSFSFTLHYRQVDSKLRKELKRLFFEVSSSFIEKGLKILSGKMVFEVLPAIEWDKGKAVSFIMKSFNKKFSPIFIGDDLTDETVFNEIKDKGITVKIGFSKNTMAKYFLRNQTEVYKFIKTIKEVLNV